MRLEQATNLCQQVNNQSSQFQMNVSFSIFAIGVIHNARTGYTTAEHYICIFKVSNGLIKVIWSTSKYLANLPGDMLGVPALEMAGLRIVHLHVYIRPENDGFEYIYTTSKIE